MKVPYSWLCEYIDLRDVTPARVAELLTLRTCEVDAVHHVGVGLDGVLIGEVVEAVKHPNADSLRITKVNIGRGELLPIVCGAPNVAAGQRVAVAPPGVQLPNGVKLEERKIRGEISRGMICSEKELGLGDDHDGIIVLEPEAEVGRKLVSLKSIEDWVIEIDNKSVNHRPDLWGIYGFARGNGIMGRRCGPYFEGSLKTRAGERGDFKISIDSPYLCRRYLGAVISDVHVAESPAWICRRLRLLGARGVSNVVDVTNYVMFEIGQPTHAFDLDKVRGSQISVRNASAGEKLVTLDGQQRTLQPTDLVIADGERAIGLAGVMGGADTEVSSSTKRVLLESASFDAPTVRRTAARLGLRSEASTRFEKTLDPATTEWAVQRIFKLAKIGFGESVRLPDDVVAAGPPPDESRNVKLSVSFVRERLGLHLDDVGATPAELLDPLNRLGIHCVAVDHDHYRCEIPSFRANKDLTEPIDLVEEIARLRGYENVVPQPLDAPVNPPPSQGERRKLVRRVEDRLVTLGFRGLETYSFLSDSLIQQLGIENQKFVTLKNSIVADQSRMRRDVLTSLIGLVAKNLPLEPDLRLFEIGKGYRPGMVRIDAYTEPDPREPYESHVVAGVIAMPAPPVGAKMKYNEGVFFRVKGFVASLLSGLDLQPEFLTWDSAVLGPDEEPYLHPRRRMFVGNFAGVPPLAAGYFGEIHPEVAARLGLSGASVAGFELDLGVLEAACAEAGPQKFTPIPRFPGITVDVALAAPENLSIGDLESLVRAGDATLCRAVSLFDIYAGAELGAGRRSAAFHVELRSDERTLTDADEAAFLKSIAAKAAAAGAELRGWQK